MSQDTSASDRQPAPEGSGPAFAPPAYSTQPPAPAYGTQPTAPAPQDPQPVPAQPEVSTAHRWTPEGLTSAPGLPPERVGRGAALSLLGIVAGALVAGIVGALGYVAAISGLVTAVVAAVLYARGSGGRVKNGIPVVVGVILVGIVASFFTVVAVELWQAWPTLDPAITAGYASRGSFVRENLFYPPVLAGAARSLAMLVVFSLLGGVGTIVRLVRTSHRHGA